jgi:hypothetical protein
MDDDTNNNNNNNNHSLTHSLTHGAEPFLRNRQLCSYSSTFQHFMEPEGSLPCSQEPSTGNNNNNNNNNLFIYLNA